MKNYWLDRIKKRQEENDKKKGSKEEKYIYPRELWHHVAKVLKNRHAKGP
jgi:hypothetical protein